MKPKAFLKIGRGQTRTNADEGQTTDKRRLTAACFRRPSSVVRLAAAILLLLFLAQTAVAQQPVTDDQVNEVAKGLYCPICESTPLDVCPTQACIDWRAQIRGFLEEGQSKEQIYTYFAQRFGDGVLAAPPRRGANLILWLFPVVAIVLGGFFFSRYLRGLKLPQPAEPGQREKTAVLPPTQTPQADYIARVEAELHGES